VLRKTSWAWPAVKLNIQSPGRPGQIWISSGHPSRSNQVTPLIERVPLFNPGLFNTYVFSLDQANKTIFTGLRVMQDPAFRLSPRALSSWMIGFLVVFFQFTPADLDPSGQKGRQNRASALPAKAIKMPWVWIVKSEKWLDAVN